MSWIKARAFLHFSGSPSILICSNRSSAVYSIWIYVFVFDFSRSRFVPCLPIIAPMNTFATLNTVSCAPSWNKNMNNIWFIQYALACLLQLIYVKHHFRNFVLKSCSVPLEVQYIGLSGSTSLEIVILVYTLSKSITSLLIKILNHCVPNFSMFT